MAVNFPIRAKILKPRNLISNIVESPNIELHLTRSISKCSIT